MTPSEILDTAKQLITSSRHEQYGDYKDQHATAAALWSAYLQTPITPTMVMTCMMLLKISRMVHGAGSQDTAVDLAGYAGLIGGLVDDTTPSV